MSIPQAGSKSNRVPIDLQLKPALDLLAERAERKLADLSPEQRADLKARVLPEVAKAYEEACKTSGGLSLQFTARVPDSKAFGSAVEAILEYSLAQAGWDAAPKGLGDYTTVMVRNMGSAWAVDAVRG